MLTTAQAAPIMLSLHRIGNDPATLQQTFEGFYRWDSIRAVFRALEGCAEIDIGPGGDSFRFGWDSGASARKPPLAREIVNSTALRSPEPRTYRAGGRANAIGTRRDWNALQMVRFFPILGLHILAGLVCLVTGIVTIASAVPARVLTCLHVVEAALNTEDARKESDVISGRQIWVSLPGVSGQPTVEAEVVRVGGEGTQNDLALLKILSTNWLSRIQPVEFASPLRHGGKSYSVLGFPGGRFARTERRWTPPRGRRERLGANGSGRRTFGAGRFQRCSCLVV